MTRRQERRDRITSAFEQLCEAIGESLGAAGSLRDRAVRRYTHTMVEKWLREDGLQDARRDPRLTRVFANAALAAPIERVAVDHLATFGQWVATEPRRLRELVDNAAPGSAGLPPDHWLDEPGKVDGDGPIPELWRIGSGSVDGAPDHEPFPVAVPLLDESHLQVQSTPYTRDAAEALVETLLLRVISYFRPGMVSADVWDVGQLTGAMPGLYPLTRTGLLTVHDPSRLEGLLEELSDHIRRVHTRVLVDGHPSLKALAETPDGSRTEPWKIVVLVGNRTALRDEDHRALQRVARNGLAAGIQLILVDVPITLSAPVETITLIEPPPLSTGPATARCTMTGPHAVVVLDDPLPRDQVTTACHKISDTLDKWRSRIGTFEDLLPDGLWTAGSASGVHAPIGFRDGVEVQLSLCDASPHALIGGPSGSGKTNLLFAMIGSLAARYPPEELAFYLLDFKEGVSFTQFTRGRRHESWLPHAKLVGVNINTDREFGLALLRFLSGEMRRRAEAAKAHEVTKLEELRAAEDAAAADAGEPPPPRGRWPRIVAVIDEFQYLFAYKDAVTDEAIALLEDVSRRGRSQGIHLVLSSQDVSGIQAFWGRPAIFEQFVLRVALPRARRVLANLNDVPLSLPRWHAVLNHESGMKHGNEIIRVPDATISGTLDTLQKRLWELRGTYPEPRLFDASRTPALADLARVAGLEQLRQLPSGTARLAVLGQLIDVEGSAATVPLGPTPGRNIAVVSSSVADGAAVLGAAALSLATQHEPGRARFTVGVLAPESGEPAQALVERLRALGHEVDQVALDGFGALVAEAAADVTARLSGVGDAVGVRPHYLLLYGVDAASGVLERKNPDTFKTGLDGLRQVLRGGPETGLHVLGWWRSVLRLRAVLTMGAGVDDIGCWVAFDVQGSDFGTLAPGMLTWSPRPARALMFDRFTQQRPEVLIAPDITAEMGPTAAGSGTGPATEREDR